jgi:Flp pilus assembly pilin Flp
MWAADRPFRRRQRGGAAVEFALLVGLFLVIVFGILELARMIYLFNTLQEVTRRAASLAVNSPFDASSQEQVQKGALFPDKSGNLVLGAPVTPAHVQLHYLSLARDAGGTLTMNVVNPLPASAAQNRLNCLADPYAASCIRLVRVRICKPGSGAGCDPVPYQMLFPLIDFSRLTLPRAETLAPAQTMGYVQGELPGS